MLHRVWLIAVVLVFSAGLHAKGIYKCVSDEGTAYQSAPCATGSEEVLAVMTTTESLGTPAIAVGNSTRHDPSSTVADAPMGPPARVPAPQNTALSSLSGTLPLGITDDQALNTPGWGPPAKIVRNRGRSGWREVWTYARTAGGARQLEFFNGRLVAVSVQLESSETPRIIAGQ